MRDDAPRQRATDRLKQNGTFYHDHHKTVNKPSHDEINNNNSIHEIIMLGRGGGGSGGGFGGFPYRSSHQQGQDGRRNNNNTNRNNRSGGRGRGPPSRSRSNNNSNITYSAELDIPSEQRGMIVGKGGSTLKWLKDVTDSKIWVPHVQQQQRRRPRQHQSQQQQNHDQNQSFSSNAENNTSEQSQPNNTSAATTQNNHPIRVNTTELSSLLHCFCEISSLLSQTNLQVSSIPCLVRMKSNASNNNNCNNNRNNGQAAMEVKVKGEVFIHSKPHTTIMPSHDYESAKKTPLSNKYACQDTHIFQGSITIPSSHQHAENASSTNTSPIQLPQHQLYAFALETILTEEDVATTVDNVQFVESSIDSCQWFYREVSHRYWSLDHAKNGASTIGTADVAAAVNDNNNNNDGSSGVRVDASIRTINNECSDKISNHNRRLVFIFGSGNDHPEMLCNAIQEATDAAWMRSCFASLSAAKHNHAIEEQEHHSLCGEENPTVNTDDTYS